LTAALGGMGIATGADINCHTRHAVFEATHDPAPHFAGKDMMNPTSLLQSGVMILEYLGWNEAATDIVESLELMIKCKRVRIDFYKLMQDAFLLQTSEFALELVKNL
jgi:isocitrate dehydrogenase